MRKRRILIIDDEEGFTRLLKLNLEETGSYEVRVENLGAMALSAAEEFVPDLVLLDLILPDVGGRDVVSALRASEALKDVPILFLTAAAMLAEHPGDGITVIPKPVGLKDLIASIEEALLNAGHAAAPGGNEPQTLQPWPFPPRGT